MVAHHGFVFVVVLTPREWFAVFAGYAALLLCGAGGGGCPAAGASRAVSPIEIPFVVFALLLPFVGPDPGGFAGLSVPGHVGGVEHPGQGLAGSAGGDAAGGDHVAGGHGRRVCRALRLPAPIVAILTFFVRYVDVVADQWRRMRMAQQARGFTVASPRSWPALAQALGGTVRPVLRARRAGPPRAGEPGLRGKLPPAPAGLPRSWAIASLLPGAAAAILG